MTIKTTSQTIVPPSDIILDVPPEIVSSPDNTTIIDVGPGAVQDQQQTVTVPTAVADKTVVIAGVTNASTDYATVNDVNVYNTPNDIYINSVDRRTLQQQITVNDVGGVEGQVQFNSNQDFAGDSGLVYNKQTQTLIVENLSVTDVANLGDVSTVKIQGGTEGYFLTTDGSGNLSWSEVDTGDGTVTSVNVSGGITGLTFTGGPVTTSGTIAMLGTLNVAHGGTGANTQAEAANNILPSQTGNAGRALTTDGTNVIWQTIVTDAAGSNNQVQFNNDGNFAASENLTFSESTLTVGTSQGISINGNTATIAATVTNSNLTIQANGTGSVLVGVADAINNGKIESEIGVGLTLVGNTELRLQANDGDITALLPIGSTHKVSVLGPTPAQYSTGLSDSDLPNKYYVDQSISSGSLPGQANNSGKFLTTDGTTASWGTPANTTYTAGNGLSLDGTEFSLSNTAVTPGSYTTANITVDSTGRVTAASNGQLSRIEFPPTYSDGPTYIEVTEGAANIVATAGSDSSAWLFGYDGTLVLPYLTLVDDYSGTFTVRSQNGVDISYSVGRGRFLLENGRAAIKSGDGTVSAEWSFNANGSITFPNGTSQNTAATGTVSSVSVSGGTTGLTTSGGPITSNGTITLGGTLSVANGGTGANTAAAAITNLLPSQTGNSGRVLSTDGSIVSWVAAATGTVSSVSVSGGTTGLTTSGGPITSNGTITLGGTLSVANGGTGANTAAEAITNLLPSQANNAGRVLTTNGTQVSWAESTSAAAGSDNQLQYNSGGMLAANSNVTVVNGRLTTNNNIQVAGLNLGTDPFNSSTNTVFGYQALAQSASSDVNNTALGYQSMSLATGGSYNTGLGSSTLRSVNSNYNTGIGYSALYGLTTGQRNTGVGALALQTLSTGSNNVGLGYQALGTATDAEHNVAVGVQTLANNLTGDYNTAVGSLAMSATAAGNYNTAVGRSSQTVWTGSNNTTLGANTLSNTGTGSNNIVIGYNAASGITSGSNNTVIGSVAESSGLNDTVIIAAGTAQRLRINESGALSTDGTSNYGTAGQVLTSNGSTAAPTWQTVSGTSSGTVTSVNVSGANTGLTFTGGPVTTNGTITLSGTLSVSNGGTGANTAATARTNLGLVIGTDVQANLGYTPVNRAGDTMTGALILNADPTLALGAATKQYVDNIASGLNIHLACRAATGNNLTATYSNGTLGVGATLTGTGALPAIDTVSLNVSDRVLVKNQANTAHNGIYTVTSNTANWVLTRASDFDNSPAGEVVAGDTTFIQEGIQAGTSWVMTTSGTITIGTTSIVFTQFGSSPQAAGSNTEIQFNDSGSFAGNTQLTFNKSTATLSTTNIVAQGAITTRNTYENITTLVGATGTVTHDCSLASIFNHSSIASNFTVNLTNLNLTSGYVTNITLILNQGATAYVPTALQIAGSAQSISWQGGSTPSGNANKRDVVSFSITNIGGTYTVFGQLVSFG